MGAASSDSRRGETLGSAKTRSSLMIQHHQALPETLSPATLGNEEGKFTKTHPKPSNKPNLPSNRSEKKASHSPRRTQPFGPEDAGVPAPTQYKARLDPQKSSLPASGHVPPAPVPESSGRPRPTRGAPRGARHEPIHLFGQSNVHIKKQTYGFFSLARLGLWPFQEGGKTQQECCWHQGWEGDSPGGVGPGRALPGRREHTCNSQAPRDTQEVCYKT